MVASDKRVQCGPKRGFVKTGVLGIPCLVLCLVRTETLFSTGNAGVRADRASVPLSTLQAVERPRVGLQDLVGLGLRYPTFICPDTHLVQGTQVGGDIGMAVVRSNHQ